MQLEHTWEEVSKARRVNRALNTESGKLLNDAVFDVLCLIAHHPQTTCSYITKHEHFCHVSLSTIKRAVLTLLDEGLVTVSVGEDARTRVFKVAEGAL
jgi:DNA-binding MarR family transcriptional regulator